MDRSRLTPEMRKIYEDLDALDFDVQMARENPGMYSYDEIHAMAEEYPKRLAEVANALTKKFNELPKDVQERTRYDVHHNRDMTDVREWIIRVQDNVNWLIMQDQMGEEAEQSK